MAAAQRSIALVVEHAVGNGEIPDESPQEGVAPVDNGVDPLEARVAFVGVALGDEAKFAAAGVVFAGPHHNPLQRVNFAEGQQLGLIVLRLEPEYLKVEH